MLSSEGSTSHRCKKLEAGLRYGEQVVRPYLANIQCVLCLMVLHIKLQHLDCTVHQSPISVILLIYWSCHHKSSTRTHIQLTELLCECNKTYSSLDIYIPRHHFVVFRQSVYVGLPHNGGLYIYINGFIRRSVESSLRFAIDWQQHNI